MFGCFKCSDKSVDISSHIRRSYFVSSKDLSISTYKSLSIIFEISTSAKAFSINDLHFLDLPELFN
jgi:hypothetical protein